MAKSTKVTTTNVEIEAEAAKAAAKEKMAKAAKKAKAVTTSELPVGVEGVEKSNEEKIQALLTLLAEEKTMRLRKKYRSQLRALGYRLSEHRPAKTEKATKPAKVEKAEAIAKFSEDNDDEESEYGVEPEYPEEDEDGVEEETF